MRSRFVFALLLVLSGCSKSCGQEKAASIAATGPLLYVTDEDKGDVVVIDVASAKVTKRIAVGKRPRGVKLAPDGKTLYVALSGSPRAAPGVDESKLPPPDRNADGIGVVDLAAQKLVRTLESGPDPESFDLSPDGKTLFVSNEDAATLTAIEISNGGIHGRAHVGTEPEGVTMRPDGKVVFVACEAANEVDVVDTTTLAVVAKVPTGPRPRTIAFTRDGATAFVTSEMGPSVTVIDAQAFARREEIVISLDSPMPSGPRPMGATFSRDEKQLFVTTGRGASVAIIDVATRKQVRSIDGVGDRAWGIVVSPDGKRLFTANGTAANVSIVDIASGNVERRVHTGGLPWGLVLVP